MRTKDVLRSRLVEGFRSGGVRWLWWLYTPRHLNEGPRHLNAWTTPSQRSTTGVEVAETENINREHCDECASDAPLTGNALCSQETQKTISFRWLCNISASANFPMGRNDAHEPDERSNAGEVYSLHPSASLSCRGEVSWSLKQVCVGIGDVDVRTHQAAFRSGERSPRLR